MKGAVFVFCLLSVAGRVCRTVSSLPTLPHSSLPEEREDGRPGRLFLHPLFSLSASSSAYLTSPPPSARLAQTLQSRERERERRISRGRRGQAAISRALTREDLGRLAAESELEELDALQDTEVELESREDQELSRGTGVIATSDLVGDEFSMEKAIYEIARAADEHKADHIIAMNTTGHSPAYKYMMLMHGFSRPQNRAITNGILEAVRTRWDKKPDTKDGEPEAGWTAIEFEDLVVHVMTPKSRARYKIDELYKNAPRMDLSDVLLPDVPNGFSRPQDMMGALGGDLGGEGIRELEEDVDPFWS
uniref:Uncharacterized protein n=1 Tax=Chromera velia CCMP2878 TaxID=1169474 RepID=A0A0G4IFI6_9ALVE|eukprot:Cvel_13921.t1-p1 / transcript=Cvel_13921.t1 / gene=Cvel_13921 / organism=Chromera_velia_CCMP2878 / gene_product=Ribosomal silencing factor RsfS, putative / transcript_product=Ribosomal silencing factor RsfS, putative / location=Cvel_scaffold970:51915-52829(+) / protein_length=305 / sequence_SO=supercontig / SO=protein_coding / is_pseudo=false